MRPHQQLVRRRIGRGVEDDDHRGAAGLVEQPLDALGPVGVGGEGLQHVATLAAEPARHGAGESVVRSDDERVHAWEDSIRAPEIPGA